MLMNVKSDVKFCGGLNEKFSRKNEILDSYARNINFLRWNFCTFRAFLCKKWLFSEFFACFLRFRKRCLQIYFTWDKFLSHV